MLPANITDSELTELEEYIKQYHGQASLQDKKPHIQNLFGKIKPGNKTSNGYSILQYAIENAKTQHVVDMVALITYPPAEYSTEELSLALLAAAKKAQQYYQDEDLYTNYLDIIRSIIRLSITQEKDKEKKKKILIHHINQLLAYASKYEELFESFYTLALSFIAVEENPLELINQKNSPPQEGTLLSLAAGRGDAKTVIRLLEDSEFRLTIDSDTLISAIIGGNIEILSELLKRQHSPEILANALQYIEKQQKEGLMVDKKVIGAFFAKGILSDSIRERWAKLLPAEAPKQAAVPPIPSIAPPPLPPKTPVLKQEEKKKVEEYQPMEPQKEEPPSVTPPPPPPPPPKYYFPPIQPVYNPATLIALASNGDDSAVQVQLDLREKSPIQDSAVLAAISSALKYGQFKTAESIVSFFKDKPEIAKELLRFVINNAESCKRFPILSKDQEKTYLANPNRENQLYWHYLESVRHLLEEGVPLIDFTTKQDKEFLKDLIKDILISIETEVTTPKESGKKLNLINNLMAQQDKFSYQIGEAFLYACQKARSNAEITNQKPLVASCYRDIAETLLSKATSHSHFPRWIISLWRPSSPNSSYEREYNKMEYFVNGLLPKPRDKSEDLSSQVTEI